MKKKKKKKHLAHLIGNNLWDLGPLWKNHGLTESENWIGFEWEDRSRDGILGNENWMNRSRNDDGTSVETIEQGLKKKVYVGEQREEWFIKVGWD